MNLETSLVYFVNDGILAGKTSATLRGYQYSVKLLIDYTKLQFIGQDTQNLTVDVVSDFFLNGIKIRKWSKITHGTYYKNLSVYFNWLVKKECLTKSPLLDIPKPKILQQPPKSFTEAETIKILRAVSSMPSKYEFFKIRNKTIVATFIFTGLRKLELMNLKCQDVDLINGFIYVENGKGGKKREIPINQETLMPILREYEAHRKRLYKDSAWFYVGTFDGRGQNGGKISTAPLYWLFKRLSEVCKLSKSVSAHKLRHTFATLFLDKTDDIYTLQQLMGHSKISTTCIYLSCNRRKKIEAINKLKFT